MRKIIVCCAFLLAIAAIEASAWEKDLHYGLTKWLAFQAGFSLQDSETIALGTEAPDEGKLYPAVGAVWHAACISHNTDLSRLVQQFHFPGYGPVPGTPNLRTVDPAFHDNAATDLVQKEVQVQLPHQPPQKTLTDLGIALHPLEDSWSHQGMPDSQWPCSRDLFWGHPAARGGWPHHDADLTFLHSRDTLDTAARTYEFLVAFLKNHPGMQRDAKYTAPPWSKLEPAVRKFAEAETRDEKRAWFQSQPDVPFASYTDQKFLDHINLRESRKKKVTSLVPLPELHPVREHAAAQQYFPPRDVEAFVENFLTLWLIKHDVEDLPRFIDLSQFSAAFRESSPALRNTDPAALSQALFFMWLVQDHGYVNDLGHGLGRIPGTEKVLSVGDQMALLRNEPLIQIESLQGEQARFHLSRYPDSADYAVIVELANAPRDAIILTVGQDARQRLLVKRMAWATM